MADRIVVMKSGVIQQVGTPEEVYESPANMFVAGFIGSPAMNFLPVAPSGDRLELGGGKALPGASAAGFAALGRSGPGQIVLGIRPEHFIVAPDDPNALKVEVDLVEPLGSDTLIHFELAGTPAIARVSPDLRIKPGDTVALMPAAGKAHLFAAESGEVIR
jgi:multiple sugar transport system ATP-binding protein